MRNPLSILIILLWLLLALFYWNNDRNCCQGEGTTETTSIVAPPEEKPAAVTPLEVTGPLLFNWDNDEAITGDGWASKKSEILSSIEPDKLLEITGRYRASEENKTTYENLGIARAHSVRALFPDIPDDRIRLLGKLMEEGDNDRTTKFESCDFNARINTSNIKEIDDHTDIYFPFNSTNKLNDREVEAYLDDVAERVKKSGERIKLTGHTDSIASAESNLELGQRRANIIKNYLVSKGVSSNKILTSSMGETRPIADNSSSEGRAKNRRTELQIIK